MYVLDASAIIDLHNHFPVRHLCNTLMKLAKRRELLIPETVQREIMRHTDFARQTVEKLAKHAPECIIELNKKPELFKELVRIEQLHGRRIRIGAKEYPGFWSSAAGNKSADGQVVAVAKALQGTVVSDDKAIQRVCLCEDISCIGWTEFARVCKLQGETTGQLFR